jgi:hypothetical protein
MKEVSFYGDDFPATAQELKVKEGKVDGEDIDRGCNLVTHFKKPGEHGVMLFQPKYRKSSEKLNFDANHAAFKNYHAGSSGRC